MKTYQAPWGRALIVISSLLVVFSIVSVAGWPLIPGNGSRGVTLLAQWALPAIVLCCLPFMIRGYVITDDDILIRRLFWTTRLDRGGLKSVESVPKAMNKSLRTCGNGGGFSFTGWYWNKSLGFYRAFVTDLNRTVVLRFEKKTVVVSPGEPEEFVADLNTDEAVSHDGQRRNPVCQGSGRLDDG
jgi:Bacterial PH domain